MTKAHNREAKIFNIMFNQTTIPADLVWKNRGRPYIERTELPAFASVCNLLGSLFFRQKLAKTPDWQAKDAQSGWRLA